jgi:hypothetical protein
MYFPEVPTLEFFDRADFPWLDEIEAATDAIRTELTTVLVADRAGLEPYVAYPEKGLPLDQWKELNQCRSPATWPDVRARRRCLRRRLSARYRDAARRRSFPSSSPERTFRRTRA